MHCPTRTSLALPCPYSGSIVLDVWWPLPLHQTAVLCRRRVAISVERCWHWCYCSAQSACCKIDGQLINRMSRDIYFCWPAQMSDQVFRHALCSVTDAAAVCLTQRGEAARQVLSVIYSISGHTHTHTLCHLVQPVYIGHPCLA